MAGMNCAISEHDYGIDGTFIDGKILQKGRRCESGFKIDFQLKASINTEKTGNFIHYPLEAKNYNDLVDTNVGTPRILIVYSMPEDASKWLTSSNEELVLRHCAWWCSLRGQEPTDNKSSKTVYMPLEQMLSVSELQSMMERVKGGHVL